MKFQKVKKLQDAYIVWPNAICPIDFFKVGGIKNVKSHYNSDKIVRDSAKN